MPTPFRRIVRRTLIAKAVVVALVVLVIGGSQVLLRQLPAHEQEVKAWVAEKLGLELQFAHLDAGWSWRGPELEFADASVKTLGGAAPFVTARAANVGFNPLRLATQLLLGREIGVDRLTFEGTELTLVKTETGYRLEGAPVSAAGRNRTTFPDLPDIDVLVRDSRVLYLDPARSIKARTLTGGPAPDAVRKVIATLRMELDRVESENAARKAAVAAARAALRREVTQRAGG